MSTPQRKLRPDKTDRREAAKAEELRRTINHTAAQTGAGASAAQATGTDTMVDGMGRLRVEAERLLRVGADQKKGNLFEYIEAAKFNANAATSGSPLRAAVTAAEGQPHAAADIVIRGSDDMVTREVQAKACDRVSKLAHETAQGKYEGMQRLVPKDKAGDVVDKMGKRIETGTLKAGDYEEARKHVTGELEQGGVRSGGTTSGELSQATDHTARYAFLQEAKRAAREATVNAAFAAGTGAVVTGAVTVVRVSVAYRRGEMTVEEAKAEVVTEMKKGGVRAGVTGGVSTAIRFVAVKAGSVPLAKSNVATAVAAGLIDVGVTTYELVKGEITPEEAVERMGQTTASTMSGLYVGAAAGAVFGPPGMLVGSVAGYFVANHTYQSCIAILRDARLAEEEAARALALAEAAVAAMDEQRAAFEAQVEALTELRRQEFAKAFEVIDATLVAGSPAATVEALDAFAHLFGWKLRFENFEAFDAFMREGDEPLRL